MGDPIALGYQCFEWVTWAVARTSWRLVCPWPLQKLVLLFLVKGSLDLLLGVNSEQSFVHAECGAQGLLALQKVAVWVVVKPLP